VFCSELCARYAVACTLVQLHLTAAPRLSLEAEARAARYAALRAPGADVIALAHHRDDQAETFLLQAARGAGVHGLAAMPSWRDGKPALWRPLLDFTREEILRYARARNLAWVEDESNADVTYRRNFVRHAILPVLQEAFPGVGKALVRTSRLAAEAAELLDVLAQADAAHADFAVDPQCAVLRDLGPVRGRNLLRWHLRQHALPLPSAARLEDLYRQLSGARCDARVRVAHAGSEIGVHRGRIVIHGTAPGAYAVPWPDVDELPLPHGTLRRTRSTGEGLAAWPRDAEVVVRSRQGGERVQSQRDGPHHSAKNLFQQAAVPAWERESWPFVWIGNALAAIPGVAVDAAFRCAQGEPGWLLEWTPAPTSSAGSGRH
jgi:tRNA(Ile)-lysidine synthase